jgi:hypothetical protein
LSTLDPASVAFDAGSVAPSTIAGAAAAKTDAMRPSFFDWCMEFPRNGRNAQTALVQ